MVAEPAAVCRLDRGARLKSSRFGRFGYDEFDQARWLTESPKRGQAGAEDADERGPFERDRARVLHSYAFRRLVDKTQVVSPGQDDFPRTRLTHSLEVAQIGREMGAELGCDPDITDAAGLAHDLGHPPFGHNGEDALHAAAAEAGGFEGNAQTLRILTRLEAKTVSDDGRSGGLNLTRATLDAVCKYPWAAGEGTRKFGVYASDLPAFQWLREGQQPRRRCLEAQVMDWADDVAYSVHDVEDGVHAGHITLTDLDDEGERQALCEQAAEFYSQLPAADLAPVLDRLLRLDPLRDLMEYDGSFRAQAAAKRATSELTGRFVGAAVGATRAAFGDPPFGRYRADLVVPAGVAAECALLKAIALRYVMRRSGVETVLARQRLILSELVEELLRLGERGLSLAQRDNWRAAADDAERLRVVIDQVAQLTDSSALSWHQRLCAAGPGARA